MAPLIIGIRCLIGIVFAASFLGKVAGTRAFREFSASLMSMGVLNGEVARMAAFAVVAAELLISASMTSPNPSVALAGFALGILLMVVFSGAIVLVIRRGTKAICRCFATSTAPLSTRHVIRNGALAILMLVGFIISLRGAGATSRTSIGVSVVVGLLCGGVVTILDSIIDLFRPLDTHVDRVQLSRQASGEGR